VVSGAACALLLLIRSQVGGPINGIAVLLLIPFFFVSVSVVSYLFGEDMYFWNRSRAAFMPYDSRSRPASAFLYFAFFTAAAVFFAVVFFKLQPG
jgi:hypothetical protein